MKRTIALLLSLLLAFSLAACGGASSSSAPSQAESSTITVQNGERALSFDEVPQRVICLNMQLTEMMLTLGLSDHIIYTCYTNAEPIPAVATAFNAIPALAEKYPSFEAVVAEEPDLVVGQIFGYREDRSGTVEMLEEQGITAYIAEGTLAEYEKIDQIYDDILNLGKIFRVEEKAQALVEEMQGKVAAVEEVVSAIPEEEKVTVFVMDSINENMIYTAGKCMETEVIKLAGGISVCEEDSDKQWFEVSAEVLLEKDPDIILFNAYGSTPVEEKITAITGNPALADLDCVKNERFMTVVLQDVNESVRVADTIPCFAKEFYPDLFT